ncbi:hypothetical protein T8K17_02920 [Thalassobaculum sp. OXR-137]|uniref:DUF2061 domain-containing protein n=1 Tax=Thalassobaculum sp. OXR-137 TaxID=3100173 RepID=UPI002AC897AA|nr:hypothetical protein [Thalassobaculum sp. OXR-137]WPZ35099.1 hypothetical protein T8K17_02920 [Thalassobaculum sp. OXR-137]
MAVRRQRRRHVGALALVLAAGLWLSSVSQASAQTQATADTGMSEVWERNLYKTLTYEVMANGFDIVLYGAMLGGTVAAAPAFILTNAALSTVAYYTHETAWDLGFSDPQPLGGWTLPARATSFRVVSSAKNYGLGLLFTADPATAAGFTAVSAVGDLSIYLINDLAWSLYWPINAAPEPHTVEIAY